MSLACPLFSIAIALIAGVTPHSPTLIARSTVDQKGFQKNRKVLYRTEREDVPPLIQAFVATRPSLSESIKARVFSSSSRPFTGQLRATQSF